MHRSRFTTSSDWVVLTWIGAMHVGALAAFFTFSWKALAVTLFLWWLTGGIGICLGYHRYFTHRSYVTSKPVEYLLAIFGCMAGESGPISWVAAHRYHHTYSDTDHDPHSPIKGFWWSHFTWLFGREAFLADFDSYKKYAPDMAKDKFIVFLDKYHFIPSLVLAVLLFAFGGWSFVVWGIFLRSVLVYHSTWLVNSASHIWGYRSFSTTDQSRNNWWVALLSFGEGWHNNHHAFQRSARHGMRWWEIDVTYGMIRLMRLLGLARQVQLPVEPASKRMTLPMELASQKAMKLKFASVALIAGIFLLGNMLPSYADANPELDGRIHEASQVLKEIMVSPDQSIPEELLAKCRAIAIYPNVIKGGFIFGGRFGKGVVLKKDERTGKWGPLAFSTIGGGSWGLQIGAQATDLILVVMNERGMRGLLSTNFTLGADASIAAGPLGRNSEAATDLSLSAGIISYSRSRGLFAGIALDGAVLTQDNASNTAYYGKPTTSRTILLQNTVPLQPSSRELVQLLEEYSSHWDRRLASKREKKLR